MWRRGEKNHSGKDCVAGQTNQAKSEEEKIRVIALSENISYHELYLFGNNYINCFITVPGQTNQAKSDIFSQSSLFCYKFGVVILWNLNNIFYDIGNTFR